MNSPKNPSEKPSANPSKKLFGKPAQKSRRATALLLSLLASPFSIANPGDYSLLQSGGVLVFAEQRYNPAVQRMLAERSLKALPIGNGALFYLVPVGIDPRHEQAQIQYLEYLLSKRASDQKK